MKVSLSSSYLSPALRLPSIQVNFWRIGIVLVGLFFGLSLWVLSTQVTLPIRTGMAVSAPDMTVSEIKPPVVANELLAPNVPNFSYEQAMTLRKGGDLVGALQQLEQMARISPLSVPVLYELGRVEFQLGKVQSAIAHYRKALTANPDHAPTAYELGSILVTLGQVDEGIQSLQHAATLAPTALYFYDLGIAQGRAGNAQAKMPMRCSIWDLPTPD
jgi:tetratricopeptide (TPR) repeat protein